MEIKVGDKVRVSKDAPKIYTKDGFNFATEMDFEVVEIEDGCAKIQNENGILTIGYVIKTKYLIKVEDEAKAKYRMGDRVYVLGSELLKRGVYTIIGVEHRERLGWYYQINIHEWHPEIDLAPYTEPTEQTDGKEPKFHIGDIVSYEGISGSMRSGRIISNRNHSNLYGVCSGIDIFHVKEEALNLYDPIKDGYISPIESEPCNTDDTDWDAYTANLARDIAVKIVNKNMDSDPEKVGEYAANVAKSVVEELKKK